LKNQLDSIKTEDIPLVSSISLPDFIVNDLQDMRDILNSEEPSKLSKVPSVTPIHRRLNFSQTDILFPRPSFNRQPVVAVSSRASSPLRISEPAIDNDLARTFQQLDIEESDTVHIPESSESHTPILPEIAPRSIKMNDTSLSQTFTGMNYKPIEVEMFIESVEEIAENSGRDASGKDRLCRLVFYNGLRGAAAQWFKGLELEVQRDWNQIKEAFNKRYAIAE
jgi:hypothetical protein